MEGTMRGYLDRFEGEFAVVKVNGEIKNFPRKLLPVDAREGDILIIDGTSIAIDKKETNDIKEKNQKLMDGLWE